MTALRYLSYDSEHGEPLIVSRTAVACAKADIQFDLESHADWVPYQRALAKDTFCAVISTHGTTKDGEFWFTRQQRDTNGKVLWRRPDRHPDVRKIAARILVVLACDGAPEHWFQKAIPGTIVIAATSPDLTAGHCVQALTAFVTHLPALETSGAAIEEVRAAWPDHENFAAAQAPAA